MTFAQWKLERRVKKAMLVYAHKRELAGADATEVRRFFGTLDIQKFLDFAAGQDLCYEARSLDVEVPPVTDRDMWVKYDELAGESTLTSKGRLHLRKHIDEEKARRFEVTTLWVKLLLPVILAVAGLIGTIAGLVAVLHKR
jgi:hypothetical protein